MAGLFRRMLGGHRKLDLVFPEAVEMPPLAVERPVAIIGDLHGCLELAEDILAKLRVLAPDAELVFVGDYIDRGERSAEVLQLLMSMPEVVCLKGNHEQMLLDFLEYPEEKSARWLRYGGLQTVASFGCSTPVDRLADLRNELIALMGKEMKSWFGELPLTHSNGNLWIVHAAAHPKKSMDSQSNSILMWGHPKFERVARKDGLWIAHGHTIVTSPTVQAGRISVDTGAYATGRLTAAIISSGEVEFCKVHR